MPIAITDTRPGSVARTELRKPGVTSTSSSKKWTMPSIFRSAKCSSALFLCGLPQSWPRAPSKLSYECGNPLAESARATAGSRFGPSSTTAQYSVFGGSPACCRLITETRGGNATSRPAHSCVGVTSSTRRGVGAVASSADVSAARSWRRSETSAVGIATLLAGNK